MKNKDIASFLVGAAVGAGLAWLFTSDEGKELVNKMKEKASALKDNLEEEISKAKQRFDEA
ncbi:MAG: YtxH domain-containing protein [Bacteroidota bacterium]